MRKFALFMPLCFIACCLATVVKAQDPNKRAIEMIRHYDSLRAVREVRRDTIQQIDVYDAIARGFFNKKITKAVDDSLSTKTVVSILPVVGYTLTTGVAFSLSGNVTFRTAPGARLSIITGSTVYTLKKQFTMPIESNIWSKSGKYLFVGDDRYYKYPVSTFGLGSNASVVNNDPMRFNFIRLYENVLRRISGNLYIGAGYIMDYHGNITSAGNTNGTPSDYAAYGTAGSTISSGITLNGIYDSRDNPINAFRGNYAAVQFRDSYEALGSTTDWSSLIIDLRHYINFPEGSGNVLALRSYNWLVISGKPPYLDLPSTSWDPYTTTGRGYIQGRFRGAQMVYGEAEYRYRITDDGLFGGVIFVNGETFSAAPGTALERIQPAFGPGLRVKLNKVSRTNICVDYGFGIQGSRGLFVNVGEVF